ncbi:MAG TPA: Hsp20/alpha crystallin family protein [Syntrophales bacterium]|nr:Hsp20/alpha crystallin family protein [Syntrophales bacterium]HPC01728.1 Hsp20/alpha crystallin family protein [Syntrophales bacterium]HPQ06630.1 Hsp20/alpha crystallin family protein [Syntrophales bacterium]HRS87691.1 Hsp20/alpha crystallin family protein [Syntrophales bacterium]HRV43291.1 Hsp20/alpha crystallin family protein [Syntrophales bacterium]
MNMFGKSLLPAVFGQRGLLSGREEEHPFLSLQREMNRLFDDFFRGAGMPSLFEGEGGRFYPSVDVRDAEGEIIVQAELPGMDDKDIEVLLTDNALTIKGEKKEEKEDKGKGYYHMERTFGAFSRTIPLPGGVDTKKAEAKFKKGVLTISLPKTEEAKAKVKKIAVKSE